MTDLTERHRRIDDLCMTPSERPLAVHARGLHKRFGAVRALDGLDLAVTHGSFYVLVGPNGAGKSTTLRALLDLVRPDRGTAHVFELDAAEDGPRARAQIGYVADDPRFGYPRLAVRDHLAHHAAYYPAWDAGYAAALLDRFGLDGSARGGRLGDLSHGQARKLQLVQALAHRPSLLLLDEPLDGLDPLARDRVLGALAEHLASHPTTVLLSTHRVHEVEGLGDTLGVLRDGRLLAQQPRSALDRRLRRVLAEVPAAWTGGDGLDRLAVTRRGTGRELEWVTWGDPAEVRERLAVAGATVRRIDPLTLEDATRALLTMEA